MMKSSSAVHRRLVQASRRDVIRKMAALVKVTQGTFLSKFTQISVQAVRHGCYKNYKGWRKPVKNKHKRPHVYEFLTNKDMYPDAPRIQTGNLRYYPKDPNYQDPPYEPGKLLMVQRVKPLQGNPHWDRQVLSRLGLDSELDNNRVVIVKNTEFICEDLWKIKHLVKVTPVTFPNGEPTEEDIERSIITPEGQMIISDAVRPDPRRVAAQEKFANDPLRLDGKTLSAQSRNSWDSGWFRV